MVPGDGSCGPSSASAFLFEDEVFGGKLRRKMNIFMAKHWTRRYQYKTQCSEKHPFVRKLAGGEVNFTDPLELIKYLISSEKAAYMRSDIEDLAVISDIYQVRIKIITTTGMTDKNPTANWIYPDAMMKEFSELKNVELGDMVLMHEKDSHFNLIVSQDSELATVGSLYYRSNIGPLIGNDEDNTKSEDEDKDTNNEEVDFENERVREIKDLKKELKQVKESKKALESNYSKCESELKIKTERVAKMSIELKDLKEIISLEGQLKDALDDSDEFEDKRKKHKTYTSKVKSNTNEIEYNCIECSFQGTSKEELKKHINVQHTAEASNFASPLQCRNCGEIFGLKSNLMNNRKNKEEEVS